MWIDAGDQVVLPIDGVAGEHVNELNTVVCMRMRQGMREWDEVILADLFNVEYTILVDR